MRYVYYQKPHQKNILSKYSYISSSLLLSLFKGEISEQPHKYQVPVS